MHKAIVDIRFEGIVGSILSKLPEARTNGEVEQIFSWFEKKQNNFCQSLSDDSTLRKAALLDICRNATRQICMSGDIIVRQGDLGDCFYVILNGICDVSIFLMDPLRCTWIFLIKVNALYVCLGLRGIWTK